MADRGVNVNTWCTQVVLKRITSRVKRITYCSSPGAKIPSFRSVPFR